MPNPETFTIAWFMCQITLKCWLAAVLALALTEGSVARGQMPGTNFWRYALLAPSTITRGSNAPAELTGSLEMRLVAQTPTETVYDITNVTFLGSVGGITGSGSYRVTQGSNFVQSMFLTLTSGTFLMFQKSYNPDVTQAQPILRLLLADTNRYQSYQTFTFDLTMAPVREVWFSLTNRMTAQVQGGFSYTVGPGSLATSRGGIVKENAALLREFRVLTSGDVGLDAVSIGPGGEVFFSISRDAESRILGILHHGDILSSHGYVAMSYAELFRPFGMQPPVYDVGIDAFELRANGVKRFSIKESFFSETQGRLIGRGDLLGDTGNVLRSNAELLAPFKPTDPTQDYGLDAIYSLPGVEELWFSVEEDFESEKFGWISSGDVLSDQGYIVFRNRRLVERFYPDGYNYALDALFVVTDLIPLAPPPRLIRIEKKAPWFNDVIISWEGAGMVFQPEFSLKAEGPYISRGLTTGTNYVDFFPGDPGNIFYRLRQW